MKDCYIKGMYETCIHAEKCSKTTYSMNNDICQGCKAYAQKLPINGTKYTPSRAVYPGRRELIMFTIVCGSYTSAEHETAQEAMEYVDENVDEIRTEGGRDYPIQITDSNNDVVAECGYITRSELAPWEVAK
jgi:hypothetical protein